MIFVLVQYSYKYVYSSYNGVSYPSLIVVFGCLVLGRVSSCSVGRSVGRSRTGTHIALPHSWPIGLEREGQYTTLKSSHSFNTLLCPR